MSRTRSGGGWAAIKYAFDVADRVGWLRLWKALKSKNTCKTCALGMGGQRGGMKNEAGHWPEVCKKSLQAMAADMQDGIRAEFFRRYGFDELRTLSPRELESSGRLVQPLYAGPGDTHYRTINWQDAMQRLADRIKATRPEEGFFYVSGRSSNEAGFLLQLFARIYGTNHVNNCSYYCHQASGVGLSASLGSGTATLTLEDVENADLLFLIGGNPASNHPRLMRTMMTIRRSGGHVIVINPMREAGLVNFRVPSDLRSLIFGTEIASEYAQPHIGGDIALLTGVAKFVLERGNTNPQFIKTATDNWDDFQNQINATHWDDIVRLSGVSREQIERIAEKYIAAKNVVFAWTMGITHHEHGVENVQMIVNLALMRGMVGRPNAGLLPIRGHSNVQGIGSMGVTPQLKDAVLQKLEERCGVKLPTFKGYDTMSCMEAAERGEMRFGVCLGGNLYGSNPDSAFAHRAMAGIDTVVYMSTTLNTGHAWGRGKETLILPVLARDEEPQKTTQESMFNYVRLSDGGEQRHSGPRSEVSVIAQLARMVLGDDGVIDWSGMEAHPTIRQWIAATVPGFEKIGDIDRTHDEFHIDGRTFHTSKFPTPTGKAQFRAIPLPGAAPMADDALRLMTVRSEGQFNTVVYEEEDLYRGQDRRDVILMNPVDIKRLGLQVDEHVTVRSETGEMQGILVRPFDVRAGNAVMYYPEVNVLVPRALDGRSRTPAFKNVMVRVTPSSLAFRQDDGRVELLVRS